MWALGMCITYARLGHAGRAVRSSQPSQDFDRRIRHNQPTDSFLIILHTPDVQSEATQYHPIQTTAHEHCKLEDRLNHSKKCGTFPLHPAMSMASMGLRSRVYIFGFCDAVHDHGYSPSFTKHDTLQSDGTSPFCSAYLVPV